MPFLQAVASGAIILGVPVLLVSTAVRGVALSEDFYAAEFARYRVDQATGLSQAQLHDVARAFIAYFQEPPGTLNVEVQSTDGARPLFNEREAAHMEDVQVIMHRVLGAWPWASAAILTGGAALAPRGRAEGLRRVLRAAAAGGAAAVLLVGSLSVGALIDFRELFLRFHFLSFANDLWLLDPARDRLIQLFPQGFFFDAALRIGVQTIVLGSSICAASLLGRWATRPRRPRASSPSRP